MSYERPGMPGQGTQVGRITRRMNPRSWQSLAAPMVLAFTMTFAAAQQLDDGILTKVSRGRPWTPPKRFGPGGTLALGFMDVDAGRLAVVTEGLRKPGRLPSVVLSFHVRGDGRLVETYRFTTVNTFVEMHPNSGGDRLITTWAAGSGHRTVIFAWEKDEVRGVLWLGWQRPPEFVDLDGDGEEEIIHAVPNVPSFLPPDTAEIYKWTGRDYQLSRTVPWPDRYLTK